MAVHTGYGDCRSGMTLPVLWRCLSAKDSRKMSASPAILSLALEAAMVTSWLSWWINFVHLWKWRNYHLYFQWSIVSIFCVRVTKFNNWLPSAYQKRPTGRPIPTQHSSSGCQKQGGQLPQSGNRIVVSEQYERDNCEWEFGGGGINLELSKHYCFIDESNGRVEIIDEYHMTEGVEI